jgi:hypothetical protein
MIKLFYKTENETPKKGSLLIELFSKWIPFIYPLIEDMHYIFNQTLFVSYT